MDWQKLIAAGLLLMMVIYLFPRAKYMLKESPAGSSKDWLNVLVIMGAIALFIVFLVSLV